MALFKPFYQSRRILYPSINCEWSNKKRKRKDLLCLISLVQLLVVNLLCLPTPEVTRHSFKNSTRSRVVVVTFEFAVLGHFQSQITTFGNFRIKYNRQTTQPSLFAISKNAIHFFHSEFVLTVYSRFNTLYLSVSDNVQHMYEFKITMKELQFFEYICIFHIHKVVASAVITGAGICDYNVPDSFCFTVSWFLHLLICEIVREDKIRAHSD